jgi:hypothetical protein
VVEEERPDNPDDELDIEIWFKRSYLGMFSNKQWIHGIDFLVVDDRKRYRCRCRCYRRHLRSLTCYATHVDVHGVSYYAQEDDG